MFSNVIVCCPANLVTGGAELLHQFVHALRQRNIDSKIMYYPFSTSVKTPNDYVHYNIEVAALDEVNSNTLIVLPETATYLMREFNNSNIAIWWLSVDNYFGYSRSQSRVIDKIKHIVKILIRKKSSIYSMRKMIHLHQSEYAKCFLKSKNIISFSMTDYLNQNHAKIESTISKNRIIAYNPKKGAFLTKKLISSMPDVIFLPLINMSAQEVRKSLEQAMLYIDFGNHPGKDRFPREAAMAGCIIITGKQGSAGNNKDLPIPEKFKVSETDPDFLIKVRNIINCAFNDFDNLDKEFYNYRDKIRAEHSVFEGNVEDFIMKFLI